MAYIVSNFKRVIGFNTSRIGIYEAFTYDFGYTGFTCRCELAIRKVDTLCVVWIPIEVDEQYNEIYDNTLPECKFLNDVLELIIMRYDQLIEKEAQTMRQIAKINLLEECLILDVITYMKTLI